MTASAKAPTIKIRYFAWVREKTGRSEETLALPEGIATIRDLAHWMQTRGDGFNAAFSKPDAIRAAVDQKHVAPDAPIGTAREIAFFPPVTGG